MLGVEADAEADVEAEADVDAEMTCWPLAENQLLYSRFEKSTGSLLLRWIRLECKCRLV